jgi:hypothetical protein
MIPLIGLAKQPDPLPSTNEILDTINRLIYDAEDDYGVAVAFGERAPKP